MSPSARDDLHSLVYLLCSLSNGGFLPGIQDNNYQDLDQGFDNTLKAKLKMTPEIISNKYN